MAVRRKARPGSHAPLPASTLRQRIAAGGPLTAVEVAKLCGVLEEFPTQRASIGTVRSWATKGWLPSTGGVGERGAKLYTVEDIVELMKVLRPKGYPKGRSRRPTGMVATAEDGVARR